MRRRTAISTAVRNFASALVLSALLTACSSSSEPRVAIASVEVTPSTASRLVGETIQLGAAVKDAEGNILSGQSVSWSSSSQAVASVSASGLVTANGEGTAIITAAAGSRSGVATITVLPAGVAMIEVTPGSVSRRVGETAQLVATAKDARGNTVPGQVFNWSSSNATVASVTATGVVTAHTVGSAVITAASGARSGVANVTVNPEPIASIAVGPSSDTLLVGETTQLTATLRDANNNVVTDRTPTWSTSQPAVATVSGTGLVTGIGDGVATITAALDGRSATSTIVVFGPCSVALAPSIAVGDTINGTLTTSDCQLDDDTYVDGYGLRVTTNTAVQIDMTASFDTYLFLLELLPTNQLIQRAINDDIAEGNTNSRINFTLLADAQYYILANSFDPDVTGNYQLRVTATGGATSPRILAPAKPGKAAADVLLRAIRPPPE